MSASGYRCVCSLCQTVLVSAMPGGTFPSFEDAARVARAHLVHRCDHVTRKLSDRELDIVADAAVEVIEGAA